MTRDELVIEAFTELRRSSLEAAANLAAILTLLEMKGIITPDEFQRVAMFTRSEMDQQDAARTARMFGEEDSP